MQKVIRFFIVFIAAIPVLSFVEPVKEKINWISISQLNEVYDKEPRPILIDVYTDWCGWCKEMDRTTYKNSKLISYVNAHYYAVRLNAESRDSMEFNKTKYGYNSRYNSNELAVFLLYKSMEFPTTVFLSAIDAQPAPLAGYMKAKEMEAPLKYFGDAVNRSQTFVEFNKSLKKEW